MSQRVAPIRNITTRPLPAIYHGFISGDIIEGKYHAPDLSFILNELSVRPYDPISAAILEFLERLFMYAREPKFPFPNQGPLLAGLANTILSYGYSTQSVVLEKRQLGNIWAPMGGISFFSMLPPSAEKEISVGLEHVSQFDFSNLKKIPNFAKEGDDFYKTFGPQHARPLGTQINMLVNLINSLAEYRNQQLPEPPVADYLNLPLIPKFVTPARIFIVQHLEAEFEKKESFPDNLLIQALLGPGEKRKITQSLITRSQIEKMSEESLIDSSSETVMISLQKILEASISERNGIEYSDKAATNGVLNRAIKKGVVDTGVIYRTINKSINTEKYAEICANTVSDTINDANTAKTMSISHPDEIVIKQKMDIDIEIKNSSSLYPKMIKIYQEAELVDMVIYAAGFQFTISCGINVIYLDDVNELQEFLIDKNLIKIIKRTLNSFSLKLYGGAVVSPFINGCINPINYSLPLKKRELKNLLKTTTMISELIHH